MRIFLGLQLRETLSYATCMRPGKRYLTLVRASIRIISPPTAPYSDTKKALCVTKKVGVVTGRGSRKRHVKAF
jgi:hypothetical protein